MGLRDPVSSLSHLLTAAWAAYATLVLVRRTPAWAGRKLAVAVYGLSMVLLFLASGAFHGLHHPTESAWWAFQRVDQSAIYLLIAGTNTPIIVCLLGLRGRWLLGSLWSLAAGGVGAQWLLPAPPHAAIIGVCLGMGWLGLLPLIRYYQALGWRAVNWVWAATACYTTGAVVEAAGWPALLNRPTRVGPHEVFHLLTVVGTLLFFAFIARHVIRHRPTMPAVPDDRV